MSIRSFILTLATPWLLLACGDDAKNSADASAPGPTNMRDQGSEYEAPDAFRVDDLPDGQGPQDAQGAADGRTSERDGPLEPDAQRLTFDASEECRKHDRGFRVSRKVS